MNTKARVLTVLAVLGGAALLTLPAAADSFHDEGYFGGTYVPIAPSSVYVERYYVEPPLPVYEAPVYPPPPAYAYAPYAEPGYYGEPYPGPGVAVVDPNLGVAVGY